MAQHDRQGSRRREKNGKKALIPFVIAQLAIKQPSEKKYFQSFALDTIANLLQKPEVAQQLETAFGFTYRDFIKMSGRYDIYNYRLNKEIKKIKKHPFRYLFRIQ